MAVFSSNSEVIYLGGIKFVWLIESKTDIVVHLNSDGFPLNMKTGKF